MASTAHCNNCVKFLQIKRYSSLLLIITHNSGKTMAYLKDEKRALYHIPAERHIVGHYSFFKMPAFCLAAFFSLCISFFCLLDLGAAFCDLCCSLFATGHLPF